MFTLQLLIFQGMILQANLMMVWHIQFYFVKLIQIFAINSFIYLWMLHIHGHRSMPKSTTSYQQTSYSKQGHMQSNWWYRGYWVVLHLIVILLTMVQIVFAIKTVVIVITLHFLHVLLNILPTMTINHIQYKIDSTTFQCCPHMRIIAIILDHQKYMLMWIITTVMWIPSLVL